MEELIEKVNNLKLALEESDIILKIKEENEKIEKDVELLQDLEEYQKSHNPQLKEKIIQNKNFREYKKRETDCNLLIMDINQRLKKELNEKKGCI